MTSNPNPFQPDQPIGAHEARTRLPDLLRQVNAGASFTIKIKEHPVARLIPVDTPPSTSARDAVAAMQAFMQRASAPTLDAAALDELRRADQR